MLAEVCAEVAAELECIQQCSLRRTRMHEATPCSLLVSAVSTALCAEMEAMQG